MILFFIALFLTSSLWASEAQKQSDRAWAITQNEIALAESIGTQEQDLKDYLGLVEHDVRWKTVKQLPEALKNNFFNLVRNIAINNPKEYPLMRKYIAGCAAAGCTIKKAGFDEGRLLGLIKNDTQLLALIKLQ